MMRGIKSINFLAATASILLLSGCMNDYNAKYTSSVPGYEQAVKKEVQTQVAQNNSMYIGRKVSNPGEVPVYVNNPYALGLASSQPAMANNNVPVINNNNAYSSLAPSAGIQSGVFMRNSTPVYNQPSAFGSNTTYSPSGGRY